MIRVAAVGDLHIRPAMASRLRPAYQRAAEVADVLLLAGDLTEEGDAASAAEVCAVFGGLDLPVVAVLGNHDYDRGEQTAIAELLTAAGVIVLEGSATIVDTARGRVGVAGAKGFCGGFQGALAAVHGEDAMKVFARRAEQGAQELRASFAALTRAESRRSGPAGDARLPRIALMHYSPVRDTLAGEPTELYPFLGNYLLAEAVDGLPPRAPRHAHAHASAQAVPTTAAEAGADASADAAHPSSASGPTSASGDASGTAGTGSSAGVGPVTLALHGHAHYGTERGRTPGGVPVRNVAAPVIGRPFAVYQLAALDDDHGAADGPRRTC
jgi:Icc-related predicted phosphoesterase